MFAQGHHNAALAGLVSLEATVNAISFDIAGANVTAKKGTVDFNVTFQNLAGVNLGCHGFAQLVGQHEGGFVLAVQITG